MRAMVFTGIGLPLELREVDCPTPGPQELLIRVSACALCRTDLHILDGELPPPAFPRILGHQVVGVVEAVGAQVSPHCIGSRVGVPWLGGSCGGCCYCQQGRENLCDEALYTGYRKDGGFAEYCCADARFVFPLPAQYTDVEAAPLLCAGLIGFRALSKLFDSKPLSAEGKKCRIGFYGFGNSAQILIQLVRQQGGEVYAFTRPGDLVRQEVARRLGAVWVGSSEEDPPELLDGALLFASVGALVPRALSAVKKGGRVVCAGIHMSPIPSFSYDLLWNERELTSVANLTRADGLHFFSLAAAFPLQIDTYPYPLERLNEAIDATRKGLLTAPAVILCTS